LEDKVQKQTGIISSLKSGILHMDPVKGKFFLRRNIAAMEALLFGETTSNYIDEAMAVDKPSDNSSSKPSTPITQSTSKDSGSTVWINVEDEPDFVIMEDQNGYKQAQGNLSEHISKETGASSNPPTSPSSTSTTPMGEQVSISLGTPPKATPKVKLTDQQMRSLLLSTPVNPENPHSMRRPMKEFTAKALPKGELSQDMMLQQAVLKKKKMSGLSGLLGLK
jgi:hypothetical protein